MNELISVIVPVYNTERYLEKCVDSIVNQTYSNLDIILIDDGSTDTSGTVCDELKKKDCRIRVFHQENSGLSAARNTGIENAKGQYIVFSDSDDRVEPDTYENALKVMKRENADVVIWGYYADEIGEDETVCNSVPHRCRSSVCEKGNGFSVLCGDTESKCIGYAWNKMYSASVINNSGSRFPVGISLVEDILFNEKVFTSSDKIVFTDSVGTHYNQRRIQTLGKKRYPDHFELKLAACRATESILRYFGAGDAEIENNYSFEYFGVLESTIRTASRSDMPSLDEKCRYVKKVLQSDDAINIMRGSKIRGIKQHLIRLLIKFRMYRLLIYIYKL